MTHAEELVESRKLLEGKIKMIKAEISHIDLALEQLAWPVMQDKLAMENKEHGDFKLHVDGVVIKGAIRKTVKWDSSKLATVAKTMSADDASELFDVSLSISEKKFQVFSECDHPALGSILMAREVKLSPFTIKIEEQ